MAKHILIVILGLICLVVLVWFNRNRQHQGEESGPLKDARLAVEQGRYQEAIEPLTAYLNAYPGTQPAIKARLYLAKAQLGLKHFAAAKSEFARLQHDFPHSEEAQHSRFSIALIELWEGRCGNAQIVLRSLLETPHGPLTAEAQRMLDYTRTLSACQENAPALPTP